MNKSKGVLIILLCVVMVVSCNKSEEAALPTDKSELVVETQEPVTEYAIDFSKMSFEEVQALLDEYNAAKAKEREEAFREAYGEAGEAPEITLEELVGIWLPIGQIYAGDYFEVTKEGEMYSAVLHSQGYTDLGRIEQEDDNLYFIDYLGAKNIISTATRVLPDDLRHCRGISFSLPNAVTYSAEMGLFQRKDILEKWFNEPIEVEPSKIPKDIAAVMEMSGKNMYVNSPEGLRVRDEPDIDGERISLLEDGQEVKIRRGDPNPVVIDGIEGYWVFVEVDGKRGWVFSGYLSERP